MAARIQPHLKETVSIIRASAFEADEHTTIASDVICMIVPKSDVVMLTEEGVGVTQLDYDCILEKPNTNIDELDIIRRSDDSELTIRRIRSLGNIMQLELSNDSDVILYCSKHKPQLTGWMKDSLITQIYSETSLRQLLCKK